MKHPFLFLILLAFSAGITRAQVPSTYFTLAFAGGKQCKPVVINLTDKTTGGTKPYTYAWKFQGGNPKTSNLANPIVSFDTCGQVMIQLYVTEAGGSTSGQTAIINIKCGPTASFTGTPTTGNAPLTAYFYDFSSPSNTISTWAWDFCDGGSSALRNPVHVFTSNGCYCVKLTVTDTLGCTGDTTINDYICAGVVGTNDVKTKSHVSLFPNPAGESATITYNMPTEGQLIITDVLGRRVGEFPLESGQQQFLLNTGGYSEGVYLCTVADKDGVRWSERLVVGR